MQFAGFRKLLFAILAFAILLLAFWAVSLEVETHQFVRLTVYFLLLFVILAFDYLLKKVSEPGLTWKELFVLLIGPCLLGNGIMTGEEGWQLTAVIGASWLGAGWWFRNIELPDFLSRFRKRK